MLTRTGGAPEWWREALTMDWDTGMRRQNQRRLTVAGDKIYDTKTFVADTRADGFTRHVVRNRTNRRLVIDGHTRHCGNDGSRRFRKRVDESFGWITTVGAGRKLHRPGRQQGLVQDDIAVYNVIRITARDTAATVHGPRCRTSPAACTT